MKATSKLISVVLILALCLSIFTISASAEVILPSNAEDGSPVVVYGGSVEEEGNGVDNEISASALTNGSAPAIAVAEVATPAELDKVLKEGASSIKLSDSFTYEGSLTLGAVTIDFGGKTLTISGNGAAAVFASGAVFKGGQLAVTGAVSDELGNKTGFASVASGSVVFRNMIMNLAGDTVLGNVSVVSGSFNKDVSANIATGSEKAEPAAAEGEQTAETRFVIQEIPVKPAAEEKVEEPAEEKVEDPVEQKVEEPAEQKVEEPSEQKPEEQKADVEAEEKTEEKIEQQVEQTAEDPVEEKIDEQVEEQKADVQVEEQTEEKTDENADKKDAEEDNKEEDASFTNDDPITVEKPEEKEYLEEVRVDEAAQQAAEEEKTTLTATDEVTGAVVTVNGFLPEGLTLVVKHIDSSMVGGLAEGEVCLLAVDISLVDADGNEYEPVNNPDANFRAVSVAISHPSLAAIAEDETLVLYHVEDDSSNLVASAETPEGSDTMSFSTSSFSPFIIALTKGPGTAVTGSEGEVHKKVIKITNLTGETYIKAIGGGIQFRIDGGAVPESVSIIDPDNVSSGNIDVYKAGYLLYGNSIKPGDYTLTNAGGAEINPVTQPNTDPCFVTINDAAVADAPTGKWAVVFWFKDSTGSGSTRVYMVQYIYIVPTNGIKGVGYNFDEATQTYEVEKCDYDALEVMLTADLESFTITRGGTTYASYDRNVNAKKMMVRIDGKNRTVNVSEYFSVGDYIAEDPLTHEFVAGKSLMIHDTLVKKLPFGEGFQLTVNQRNKQTPENPDSKTFTLNITPGIAVADGLSDYIKGRNTWIKFIACAPIDYDSDGTLAIWIGGQKISHDYYSISNDHQTLWIYRNLLDQLKSNNSYTLTARLWRYTTNSSGHKVKTTYYPATASFNILAAGSTSYRSPKTGDESNVALWAAVLLLSGGAVIALVPKKKKSK